MISLDLQTIYSLHRGQYLADSGNNGVRGGAPKGIDHLPEDDRHDHHRHAVAQRPNHAGQHQQNVRSVGTLKHAVERNLSHCHHLLATLLHFPTLHCIASGSFYDAFFCHVVLGCLAPAGFSLLHMAPAALLYGEFLL
ncbi:uncharacterized protein LOC100193360 [Zea mays]|uniref:Uncharacterized protein n=1 Tax=Zea mays TaxID=4577 RepID=B4FER6_MAIZE|nr:uncharacterized protein LOC100193360 [Zea mays]ACF80609.1 unknown [Zea mays]